MYLEALCQEKKGAMMTFMRVLGRHFFPLAVLVAALVQPWQYLPQIAAIAWVILLFFGGLCVGEYGLKKIICVRRANGIFFIIAGLFLFYLGIKILAQTFLST